MKEEKNNRTRRKKYIGALRRSVTFQDTETLLIFFFFCFRVTNNIFAQIHKTHAHTRAVYSHFISASRVAAKVEKKNS